VSALDLSVQAQILNLLLELQRERGVAYLFITHDLAVVRHMSTRIAVLQQGHLVEEGDADAVTQQPAQPYTRRLIAASLSADADLQHVRRATRTAIARLAAAETDDHADLGDEVLTALENQAVAEVLARPAPRAAALSHALVHAKESADDVGRVVGLRASLIELSPRTSEDMLSAAVVTHVHEARARRCEALSAGGHVNPVVSRLRELATVIETGDRQRALSLVSSLDEPSESAAKHGGAAVAPPSVSRPDLDHHEKKGVSP